MHTKTLTPNAMTYTIAKSSHFSSPRTNILPLSKSTVEGTWIFNETIKYEPDIENDWNKLFGIRFMPPLLWAIKNPTKIGRYNCAMVAFRWKDNQLELSPYLHRNGSMEMSELLGNTKVICAIGQPITTKIQLLSNLVIFTIKDQVFTYEFPAHGNIAFAVQPYFGGQAVAPHSILIQKV